jgi:formate hydrogenlyase subunit 3/multisubunit Na+/H+ antiporter MnhD subunit
MSHKPKEEFNAGQSGFLGMASLVIAVVAVFIQSTGAWLLYVAGADMAASRGNMVWLVWPALAIVLGWMAARRRVGRQALWGRQLRLVGSCSRCFFCLGTV